MQGSDGLTQTPAVIDEYTASHVLWQMNAMFAREQDSLVASAYARLCTFFEKASA